MASPNTNTSFLVTGRMAYGCTNLATAWPHGGTGLGLVGGISLSPPSDYAQHLSEGINSTWEVTWRGGNLVMGALVEGWEDDAYGKVLPNVSGTTIQWPGSTTTIGTSMDPRALSPLVFTPRNQTEHPAVILYKAIPILTPQAQMALSSFRFLNIPVLFVAQPDASDRLGAMDLLANLSL